MSKPRPTRAQIIAHVAQGATNEQLAAFCGITVRQLDRDRARDADLNDGIMAARRALAEVRASRHGTSKYARGCRCDVCRYANAVSCREAALRRRARAGLPPPDPGRGRPRTVTIGTTTIVGRAEQIEQAIARGLSTTAIMARFGCDYAAVKTARDALLEGAA